MKILFLGVSPALAVGKNLYHSNMLVMSESGQGLLIDCGTDIKHSLYAQGYAHENIGAVYISHLHSDHIGGLEWLGFCKYFIERRKPQLFISNDQKDALWNHALAAGMSTLEEEQATLSTFFEVEPIKNNSFTWEGYAFQLIKTLHTISNKHVLPSYGLFITVGSHKIFLSTDSRLTYEPLKSFYERADIIFHDCETFVYSSGQHARYEELRRLDANIRSKMWLYDYDDHNTPNAVADGFKGFVVTGQSFSFPE